jgi:hypothetical protein
MQSRIDYRDYFSFKDRSTVFNLVLRLEASNDADANWIDANVVENARHRATELE